MKFSTSLISFVTAAFLVMQATAAPVGDSPLDGLQSHNLPSASHVVRRHDGHSDFARRGVFRSSSQKSSSRSRRPTPKRPSQQQSSGILGSSTGGSTSGSGSSVQAEKYAEPQASSAESDVPTAPSEDVPTSPLSLASTGVKMAGSGPQLLSSTAYSLPLGETQNLVGTSDKAGSQAENPPKTPAAAENTVQNDSSTVTDAQKNATNDSEKDAANDTKNTEGTTKEDTPKAASSEVSTAESGPSSTQNGGRKHSAKGVQKNGPRPVTRREEPIGTFEQGRIHQSAPAKGGENHA